jgi:hypothetical protein
MKKFGGSGALALLRSAWRGRTAGQEAAEPGLEARVQAKVLQIIQLGCPRGTAANYVGLTAEQFEEFINRDEKLAREVLRAEAEAAVLHMGNVHKASQDGKNWRPSVWWLENRGVPSAEAAEDAADYPEVVLSALDRFAELIVAEIPDVMRRQSLLLKLRHITVESMEPAVVIDVEPMLLEGAVGAQESEASALGRSTPSPALPSRGREPEETNVESARP